LQTGLLVLEFYFALDAKATLDDLLLLNERLRYREEIFQGHYEDKSKGIEPIFHKGIKSLFHPNDDGKTESARLFDYWLYLLQQPLNDGDAGKVSLIEEREGEHHQERKTTCTKLNIYADSRTFVWTCAVLPKDGEGQQGGKVLVNKFSSKVKELFDKQEPRTDSRIWQAHNYGHWIKLLNVDSPADTSASTHESMEFEREWAKERTYHRWEEWGSFYGFSYHSGAAMLPPFKEPENVPLWKHWGMMYFDMFLLLLYVRVTLFRFSNQLTTISSEARGKGSAEIEKWCSNFEDLRWEFALFTNLYQFPLISNQQQGLEMYALARKCLDVDDLYKEIQSEIQSSHEFLQQRQQNKQSNRLMGLTWVATIGLSISIALAFMSTAFGKEKFDALSGWMQTHHPFALITSYFNSAWLSLVTLCVISFFIVFIVYRLAKGKED
jgi:hypothetical protein